MDINRNEPYTHGVIIENPKNKSDINITTNGRIIPTHLCLNVVLPNIARAVIGAKFGGFGTILNKIANTQNNNTNDSLFIIVYCGGVSRTSRLYGTELYPKLFCN